MRAGQTEGEAARSVEAVIARALNDRVAACGICGVEVQDVDVEADAHAIADALLRDNPTLVLRALGGVYNGSSTTPYHWWRLPLEGQF